MLLDSFADSAVNLTQRPELDARAVPTSAEAAPAVITPRSVGKPMSLAASSPSEARKRSTTAGSPMTARPSPSLMREISSSLIVDSCGFGGPVGFWCRVRRPLSRFCESASRQSAPPWCDTAFVVRTGKRAQALAVLLTEAGLPVADERPPAPRSEALSPEMREDVLDLYRSLGGRPGRPLRPGAWDLALTGGDVVELDEELHFNRYRAATLERSWSRQLPWRDAYVAMCRKHEAECASAGSWGMRWTNASCEAAFGIAGAAGDLDSPGGAPRWKQRALYDAVKDAYAATRTRPRLIRLAVHDDVGGTPLGAVLRGTAQAAPEAVRELVRRRTG